VLGGVEVRRWALAAVAVLTVGLVVATLVVSRSWKAEGGAAAPVAATSSGGPLNRVVTGVVIGDSYTAGSPAGGEGKHRWVQVLGQQLVDAGLRLNLRTSLHSGASYVARGPDGKTFRDAVLDDVRPTDDLVVIYGSTNDYRIDPQLVEDGVDRTLDAVEATAPKSRVVVIGPGWAAPELLDTARGVAARVGKVAREHDSEFVDPLALGWYLGENAGLISPEFSHPTDEGHAAFASDVRPILEPLIRRASGRPAIPGPAKAPTKGEDDTGRRLVYAMDDTYVAKAYEGSCRAKEPSQVDVSTDLGGTFGRADTPASQVLGLARAGDVVAVVGLDSDCRGPQRFTPSSKGTWTTSSADDLWYLDVDRSRVHAPGRTTRPGCDDVLTVSPLDDDSAAVGCGDGTLRGTTDGGRTWSRLGELPGLRAVAYRTPAVAVAFAAFQGCGARVFTTSDGGGSWTARSCLEGKKAQAMTASDDGFVGLIDNYVFASADDGLSWSLKRRAG